MSPVCPKPELVHFLRSFSIAYAEFGDITSRQIARSRRVRIKIMSGHSQSRRELGVRAGQSWTSAQKSKVEGHLNQGYRANGVHPRFQYPELQIFCQSRFLSNPHLKMVMVGRKNRMYGYHTWYEPLSRQGFKVVAALESQESCTQVYQFLLVGTMKNHDFA